MASQSSPDPIYVKTLEQQIARIERENRRLKREVLTLTPGSSNSSKDSSPGSVREPHINDTAVSTQSFQLDDLEDIDLDEVLEAECDDSWIYKSPVRQTPEQARMTPEQWLVQGLQDGPVVKNRDNLKDVRRDLSSLLGAETTPGGFTNAVDDRSGSPASLDSSSGHLSTANSSYTVSPSTSYLRANHVSPGALGASPVDVTSRSTSGARSASPRVSSNEDIRYSSPSPDHQTQPSSNRIPAQASHQPSGASSGSSRLGAQTSLPLARSKSPQTGTQRRSLAGPSGGSSGLAAPRSSLAQPSSSAAKAAPTSRLSGPSSRLTKPAASSSAAPAASGLRQPAPAATKSRLGGPAAAGSRSASGISRPASQVPRSGLPQPSKSGLQAPRRVSSTATRKDTQWQDGCY